MIDEAFDKIAVEVIRSGLKLEKQRKLKYYLIKIVLDLKNNNIF